MRKGDCQRIRNSYSTDALVVQAEDEEEDEKEEEAEEDEEDKEEENEDEEELTGQRATHNE